MLLSRRDFLKGLATIAAAVAVPVEIIQQVEAMIQEAPITELPVSSKLPPGFLEINGLLIPCYRISVSIPRGDIFPRYRPSPIRSGRYDLIGTHKPEPDGTCDIEVEVSGDTTIRTIQGWDNESFRFAIRPALGNFFLTGQGHFSYSSYGDDSLFPDEEGLMFYEVGIRGWDYQIVKGS